MYVVLCFLVLVVGSYAVDCLESLVSEMTCYMSSGMLNPAITNSWKMVVNVARVCILE